ncbi:hypothetical protein SAMN04487983_103943 [Streptomyces sp. yr375]|uniref:hypothetical protein n=1 Tax=Streptomyces sp. yr375 TaxID=1761906 RepID=UPI0008B049A2|nr:hypothetical protein [Streptomyces sp. yr375]SES27257.1 hypothetical protein SAMN04487983_103943 [Streptomyces sp. yr375]
MRALVSRGLLLSPVVCAALIFGPAGTAAATADIPREAAGGAAAARYFAEPDAVLAQLAVIDQADRHDGALDPMLDALSGLADRTAGPLDATEAATVAKAVEKANASLQQRLKERAGATTPTSNRAGVAAADPVSDLVAQLQSAVSGLLTALTSLDLGAVLGAVTGLLAPVLGAITGLLGGALPSLPELPTLPTLPATEELPTLS